MKKDTPKNTKELKKQMKKDEKKALQQDVLKLNIECHKTMKTISDLFDRRNSVFMCDICKIRRDCVCVQNRIILRGCNMSEKKPLIKTAEMTDEEWSELESLVAEYQEKNPDWERTGFETIEDMKKLIAGETLTTDREKAEKAFEDADIANANKRAEELRKYAIEYQNALRQVTFAKLMLKNVVKQAEKDNFSKWQLESIVYAMNVQEGFERMVLEEASKPYNPERPETKTDDSEKPNCDEEPMTDSENESVADEGVDTCEEQ